MSIENGVLPAMAWPLWQAGQERMSQEQLVQFFFTANDQDGQMADYGALQMAQRQPIFEQGNNGARQRHQLPPRRHLRS